MGDQTENRRETESLRDGFRASLPLLATSCLLFVAAVISRIQGVTVGQSHYPLGVFLAALGFVAAIGAVLSWFFAGNAPRVAPSWNPKRPEYERPFEPHEPGGHPRPQVRRDPVVVAAPRPAVPSRSPPPWDEGSIESPPVAAPVLAEAPGPTDMESTLAELDGIEAELNQRRGRAPP